MQRSLALTMFSCAIAASTLPAQLPRGDFKANNSALRTLSIMRQATVGQARIVSPPEQLPADIGKGLYATANVAYCVWVEQFGGGYHVMFRRSTDGGYTWEKEKRIHYQPGTGNYDFEQFDVAATQHDVFVAMSTGNAQVAWPNDVWLVASDDQGQNWTQPLQINTLSSTIGQDADSVRVAAHSGRAHIAYQFADPSNNNDLNNLFYVGAEMKNGQINIFKSDTRVNVNSPPFRDGVAYFDISASAALVAICFNAPRVSSNEGNLYVAVARDFGMSFGSASTITQITGYTASNPRTDPYWECKLVVTSPHIYVVWNDNRVWPNNVYFTVSNNLGGSFAKPVLINKGAQGADSDDPVIAADGSLVAIAWHDDRDGSNNLANSAFVAVDDQAGQKFLNGTFQELRLDTKVPLTVRTELPSVSVAGQKVAIVYETSKFDSQNYQMEDAVLVTSTDAGQTWSSQRNVTNRGSLFNGSIDVDSPQVHMTAGGAVIAWWADDRNSSNDLWISGMRLPELVWLGKGKGHEVRGLLPADQGSVAILLVTEAGTRPAWQLTGTGITPNFVWGTVTPIFLGLPMYIGVVPPSLVAKFPTTIDGLGIFDMVGLGLDLTKPGLAFSWYTDPLRY